MLQMRDVGRTCGPCTACCKPLAVPEVGKFDGGWCKHAIARKGCSIYENRPYACKAFTCLWLNGVGPDEYRPDLLGVMMDTQDCVVDERKFPIIHLYEIRTDALDQPIITELIDMNKAGGNAVVLHRMTSATTYDLELLMSRKHFTAAQAEYVQTVVMDRSTTP
jgi:hypothetical protein